MTEIKNYGKELAESADRAYEEGRKPALRVYRKESAFAKSGGNKYWYSATRSDGCSVNVKFDNDIDVPDLPAFEITDVVGTLKHKTVEKGGETYENYTYYVSSCACRKIEGDDLPL